MGDFQALVVGGFPGLGTEGEGGLVDSACACYNPHMCMCDIGTHGATQGPQEAMTGTQDASAHTRVERAAAAQRLGVKHSFTPPHTTLDPTDETSRARDGQAQAMDERCACAVA